MSGTHSNKRPRTTSSLQDDRLTKHKTKDRANARGTNNRTSTSTSSANIETREQDPTDSKGGRSLRPRKTKAAAESEEEDNSADESWTPGAAVTSVQKPITSEKLQLEKFFQCTDRCMDKFFAEIGIVLYFQNPPPPIPCMQVHEHTEECVKKIPLRIVASNVTRELLSFYAAWVFANANLLVQQETAMNTAANIYKPISLISSRIPWNARPFTIPSEEEDCPFKLDKDLKLDRNIRLAWWWFRRRLMDGPVLKIPLEWTDTDESLPHDRPEMPDAFRKLLKKEEPSRPPHSTCSSLDGTPLKRVVSTVLANAAVKPLNLGIIQEQDELFSPLSDDKTAPEISQLTLEAPASAIPAPSLPQFELKGVLCGTSGTTVAIKCDSSESAEPSDLPATRTAHDSFSPEKFKLAYSLIKKYDLKETKEDALRLEQYLADPRRKFDINQSKRELCAILGPAEKHTVRDRDFTGRSFAYVPKAHIEEGDKLERCGNAGRTENAVDIGDTAMELNIRWLKFKGIDETGLKEKADLSELDIERKVGDLIVGLFKFDELKQSANKTPAFLKHLQLFNTFSRPDYAVKPKPEVWSHWPKSLHPIMASGDVKTLKSTHDDNAAQLAFNTRAVIILQILMHLDTREDADTPLPGWMFNLAWILNHRGFTIYAHYPSIKVATDGSWSWKMVSVMLTDTFSDIWGSRSTIEECQQAKAAFDMVVSHTSFVLDQIRNWSQTRGCYGEGSIMNQLIAKAHLEEGNYDWLYKKMKEVKKEGKGKDETATEATAK